ncbi:hypothetical protein FS837_005201 [Tulasnella sp. UAMH 9824]|nr:hypothetical protein FS837_005201 [Tulasnella sp. UAMH 9824]
MPPKHKPEQRTANNSNSHNASEKKDNAIKDAKGAEAAIPGLSELVALVETIASTPPGKEPVIDQNALEVIETTPLNLVYTALKPVFLKLGIAEAAAEARSPWARGNVHEDIPQLKSIEDKVDVLSRNADDGFKDTLHGDDLKAASQALEGKITSCQDTTMAVMRTSAKDTADRLETIHSDVKAVPAAIKGDITALDLQFTELRKELIGDAQGRIQKLELRNDVLEKELKEMKDAADATSFALLPVNFALESAISGYFPTLREAKAACVDAVRNFPPTYIMELAAGVREDVFRLLSYCQALFSVLSKSQAETSGIPQIGGGFEQHWAEAFESAHRLHVDAQESYKKERESIHQLKFFGFLVDQVRDGQTSLDQWVEASQNQDFGDYMDQPFDGFDALQTVADELHQLRRTNALLKRQLLPSTARGVRQPSKGGWSPLLP